jgi:uncharacterized protein YndB with AHSA1/START domain
VTTASIEIAAPAEVVWSLVSDLSRMAEWSPETSEIKWTRGATGPSVGATFKGKNRIGRRRWTTDGKITVANPPNELVWEVTSVGMKVAEWRYLIEPIDDLSCRLTESTVDQRKPLLKTIGALVTGVKDRQAHNPANLKATLERIKEVAEFAP